MPTPDDTGLDLALAGDYSGANEWIGANHPDRYLDTTVSAALRATANHRATSISSMTIKTSGDQQFTLDSARGFQVGDPLLIMDSAAPSTNWMWGQVKTAETAAKVVVVTISKGAGSGTYTSWNIFAVWMDTYTVSTPVTLAQGGFASDMSTSGGAVTGRLNVEVPHSFDTLGVRLTVPGSPSTGDTYIAGAVSGAFATIDHVYRYNGASWDDITPVVGDEAWVPQNAETATDIPGNDKAVYIGSTGSGSLFVNSSWRVVGSSGQVGRWRHQYAFGDGLPHTIDTSTYDGSIIRVDGTVGVMTFTLDTAVSSPGAQIVFARIDSTSNHPVINVASSGNITSGGTYATSYTMSAFETRPLISDGASFWHAVGA